MTLPVQVRAVGFDLDDTLLDHTSSAQAGIRAWLGQRGIAGSEDLDEVWIAVEHEFYGQHKAGLIDFAEQRRRRIAAIMRHVGIDAVPDDTATLDALFLDYLTVYAQSWAVFDDVVGSLKRLRDAGFALGLLTNGNRAQQEDKLRRIGLFDAFDVVLCMNDVPEAKPSPLAFGALADALGVPSESVVYVGDHLDYDVAGAIGAGMRAVWLDRQGSAARDDVPAAATRIETLDELSSLLAYWR